jgi:uncharacterized membrane protein YhaH (DUF805 family)
MNLWEAVRSGFRNYATFIGRAVRSEYWYWSLFVGIVAIPARLVDTAVIGYRIGPLHLIWDLVILLPSYAVAVRRLHDTNRSGWWLLAMVAAFVLFLVLSVVTGMIYLTFIGVIAAVGVTLYFFTLPGTPGPNRYGPDPFGPDGHISPRPTT